MFSPQFRRYPRSSWLSRSVLSWLFTPFREGQSAPSPWIWDCLPLEMRVIGCPEKSVTATNLRTKRKSEYLKHLCPFSF